MKLSYIETEGYMLVAADNGEEIRCFIDDDPNNICYMSGKEQADAALNYLKQIDTDCFLDWDATDSEGNPLTIDALADGCAILAELEA